MICLQTYKEQMNCAKVNRGHRILPTERSVCKIYEHRSCRNEGNEYLSRTASCHLCSFAISFTWNPKIRGLYLSAFKATAIVLSPSAPAPSTGVESSLFLLGRLEPFPLPSPPSPPRRVAGTSMGPLFDGIREG